MSATETHPAALPSDHAGLVERLTKRAEYHERKAVDNADRRPLSDNEHKTAQLLREALAALGRVQPVAVKPLEWEEYWSGGDEDIPAWRAKCPLGLHISFSFAGRLFDGRQIERHSEAPVSEVEAAKAAKQAGYERRILSAIASPPAPQPALALIEDDHDWTQTAFVLCERLGIERKADAHHIVCGIEKLKAAIASAKRFKGE